MTVGVTRRFAASDRRPHAGLAEPDFSEFEFDFVVARVAVTTFAGLLALIGGVSCASIAETPKSATEEGRRLYLTCSGSCHSPEPVRKFPLHEWERILPEMSKEARLSGPESEVLRRYVLSHFQLR